MAAAPAAGIFDKITPVRDPIAQRPDFPDLPAHRPHRPAGIAAYSPLARYEAATREMLTR